MADESGSVVAVVTAAVASLSVGTRSGSALASGGVRTPPPGAPGGLAGAATRYWAALSLVRARIGSSGRR
ncbi:hypothetical protein Asera_46320 [Actinocatenispora sera]|uniref:Uncharacterized protein n=1 Tax=Actinocatenispora sera TaxID=390989 RepID=A0A810L4W2_9ACTN|nr:hypothetical protein Asera_46320 [Actinocatenispora sera]